MLIKLSEGNSPAFRAYAHANTYEIEQTTGPQRLKIAPGVGHVELVLALAETWHSDELAILYVLFVPRRGERPEGRYESPRPLSLTQAAAFFRRFAEYFECDARHEIWLQCQVGPLLVYDHHQYIYAYGDTSAYTALLMQRGLMPGPIRIPVPHRHHYHAEFDAEETALFDYWTWLHTPLLPEDN